MSKSTCSVDECSRPVLARGWCSMHYHRWRAHGDPGSANYQRLDGDVAVRFWSRVQKTDSCWLWEGGLNHDRYGQMRIGERMVLAHRYSYESLLGDVPEGLELDHLCRVRHCVNPSHLEPVLHRENVLRGVGATAAHARQVQCKNGHPFDEANTYWTPQGFRKCRVCTAAAQRRYQQRKLAHIS